MRTELFIGILCTAILLGSCSQAQRDEETLLAVMPCAECPAQLTAAACFEYGGDLYVFGGRDAKNAPSNGLYTYYPATDTWSKKTETPLSPRVRPRAVRLGENVYMGLGFDGKVLIDTAYRQDWWKWTPVTDTWEEREEYPSQRTVGPVVAANGTYIYAAMGGKQNFERWIYRYDTTTDEWTKLADGVPRMADYPPRAHSAAGAYCAGKFFLGAGYTRDGSSDFWTEAELTADSVVWHKCRALNGKRHNAATVSDGRYIYLAGGHFFGGTVTNGTLYNDILRYDPLKDTWTRIALLPNDGRENMCLWIQDNTLYAGLGNDKYNRPCAQLYKIRL